MKRICAFLLVVAMLLAMAGCSSTPPAGTVTKTPNATNAITKPTNPTTPQEPEVTVSLGRLEGGTYENDYAHFGCTLDSSWTYYSAEDLQELSELTQDLLQDSELPQLAQITDMKAENVEELCSVNILYTRLSLQDMLVFSTFTEEQIVDGTLEQKDTMIQAYASAGIEDAQLEKVRFQFLGEEHVGIHTSATIEGIPYYITQAFLYNLGGRYYVTVTMASYVEDNTASLLDLFYPIQ